MIQVPLPPPPVRVCVHLCLCSVNSIAAIEHRIKKLILLGLVSSCAIPSFGCTLESPKELLTPLAHPPHLPSVWILNPSPRGKLIFPSAQVGQ